jgi:hypothetical protein
MRRKHSLTPQRNKFFKKKKNDFRDLKKKFKASLFPLLTVDCYVYLFLLLCLRILNVMFMYSYYYVYLFLFLCSSILNVMFMYSYCYVYIFLMLNLCILNVMFMCS